MTRALSYSSMLYCFFFFSSRRRHTRWNCDWSSDVCSSDLANTVTGDNLLLLYAGGLVQVQGVVNAPQIFVTSSDIDIIAEASLGVAGVTQLIALNAMSDTPIYIRSEERRVGKECRSVMSRD